APAEYGFRDLEFHEPLAFETVWVPGAVSLETVGAAAGTDGSTIRELNPHLLRDRTPRDRGWAVRIPQGTAQLFASNFPAMYRQERARLAQAAAQASTHRVSRGETFSHIAARYGVSVAALRSANGGIAPHRL